jgi:transcriptional regulator with XRE-family HTH domain
MPTSSVHSLPYKVLLESLIQARKDAGFTQEQLAKRLKKPYQSFVAKYEIGERRLDLIEVLQITKILKADPHAIIKRVFQAL